MKPLHRLRKLMKDDRGVFTLEASLLFPILLILSVILVFFFIVIFQVVSSYHSASMIADRLAYNWDNSQKHVITGDFNHYTSEPDHPDGLYWRIFGNNILEKFGISLGDGSDTVNRKISRADEWRDLGSSVDIRYSNSITGGEIEVIVRESLNFPTFFTNLIGLEQIEESVTRDVYSPVEFLRNTEFVLHYSKRMMNYYNQNKIKKDKNEAIQIFN